MSDAGYKDFFSHLPSGFVLLATGYENGKGIEQARAYCAENGLKYDDVKVVKIYCPLDQEKVDAVLVKKR